MKPLGSPRTWLRHWTTRTDKGVIHRDIKPVNVLMLDGKPVISDFGIALAVGTAGRGRLTETLGTGLE